MRKFIVWLLGRDLGIPLTADPEVIPGLEHCDDYLTNSIGYAILGKDGRYHHPIPMYRLFDGSAILRWRIPLRQRLCLLFTGSIWHRVGMSSPYLPPTALYVECPLSTDNTSEPWPRIDLVDVNLNSSLALQKSEHERWKKC